MKIDFLNKEYNYEIYNEFIENYNLNIEDTYINNEFSYLLFKKDLILNIKKIEFLKEVESFFDIFRVELKEIDDYYLLILYF